MQIKCAIGLGNPGEAYAKTRHNIGFMVADGFACRYSVKFSAGKGSFFFARARLEESGEKVLIAKPTTYMNLSGIAVAKLIEKEELEPENIIIIFDDFELPFGQLRLKPSGSAGCHNGMTSVIEVVGTEEIPRLRVGVGPLPEGDDAARFVLSPFRKKESERLPELISRAGDALEIVFIEGIEAAMNIFNKRIESQELPR